MGDFNVGSPTLIKSASAFSFEVFQLYERKSKQRPFLPSIGYNGLSKPPKPLAKEKVEEEELKREKFSKNQDFVDAETGESLELTKAKWTAKEGRLSLTAKTILNMGTGKLDLKLTSKERRDFSDKPLSIDSTQLSRKHSLVDRFIAEGPLTPMMHKNWDPLTNEITRTEEIEEIEEEDDMPFTPFSEDRPSNPLSPSQRAKYRRNTVSTASTTGTSVSTMSSKSKESEKEYKERLNLSIKKSQVSASSEKSRVLIAKLQEETKPIVTEDLGMFTLAEIITSRRIHPVFSIAVGNKDAWDGIYQRTFYEIFDIAEKMETNKSMTQEEKFPGGIVALRKACQQLA
jgi:hypothetical protein